MRVVDVSPSEPRTSQSKRPVYQDWKKVKFGKKEPRVPGKHDFSFRLEATKKDNISLLPVRARTVWCETHHSKELAEPA